LPPALPSPCRCAGLQPPATRSMIGPRPASRPSPRRGAELLRLLNTRDAIAERLGRGRLSRWDRNDRCLRSCASQVSVLSATDYSGCSRGCSRRTSSSRPSGTSSDPLWTSSRMRRAFASKLDGTNNSAGPVGYGPCASPLKSTGIPSASSRPFAISPSTHDCVQKTDTKSSAIAPSFHVRVARCPASSRQLPPPRQVAPGTRLARAHQPSARRP
jgi:hypothetical protein